MNKILALSLAMLVSFASFAQKPKAVEFATDGLPDQLLEYMNKQTQDGSKQKDNIKLIKSFRASYTAMDEQTQLRVTAAMNYAVKAKMRANPDMGEMTRVLTVYATAPGGSQNLDGWLSAMDLMRKKNAKAKALTDFVDFSSTLLADRELYSTTGSRWWLDAGAVFRLAADGGEVVVYVDMPANLHYASAKDEGVIYATTGRYRYKDNIWEGDGGRIDWSRTGLGAEACFATLGKYKAEVKTPKWQADSVQFVNTHYFSQPIMGRVEEKLENKQEPDKYSYPRFRSYQRDFVIKDVMPDVDYNGSFMMNGGKFVTASSKQAASLVFRREGKPQLRVTALKFSITQQRLVAENAQVAFYVGDEDSISNTGITVRYMPAEHKVLLVNDPKRNFYSPYIDSYHELDIYSDVITWYTNKPNVEFSTLATGTAGGMVSFESSNYYTYRKYREIQGIDSKSPVERVYDYAETYGYNFNIERFSDYIGLDMSQTMLMIHNLSKNGLVSFNEITGRVLVKDKLEDYMKAHTKARDFDYDALAFESSLRATDGSVNARLNIDDNDLSVRGVEQFVVSDSQRVVVHPRGGRIKVGRNRSISFDGRIDVGRFIMFVSSADFSYERYSFELPQVDSLFFYVPMFDRPDSEHMVMTPLYGLVGSLEVDKPDNHSGLTSNKQYPIFNSREESHVYYDKQAIREGRYVRDRFYYTLHPFTISSLVKFVTDSLQFNGVLTSGGIFPDITYPLSVQRDYYLGFRVETPAGGYPAYGGKGEYKGNISLDHYGLQAKGGLDYLTSHSTSRSYLFLLDSMLATTDTFTVREEQGYPDVKGGKTSVHWLPYADSMAVATVKGGRPLSMYHADCSFRGRFDLMPRGAEAAGTAIVKEGTLESDRFLMASRQMDAEVSNFTLRSRKLNAIAFTANNVRSHVDYDTRQAELTMPNGPQRTELQLVAEAAYADRFNWDMDRRVLDITNSQRLTAEGMDFMDIRQRLGKRHDLPGVRFVSTDPKRDELGYHSLHSTYKYEVGDLSSTGVFLLTVADAAIAPNADSVHINRGGEMRVLNNATIVFNQDSAWHQIVGADLIVSSSRKYTGKGYNDYRNDTDKRQRIFLNDISVDGRGVTVAKGTISDSASFQISSAFGFAGKVRLEGDRPWPHFDGGVRLLQPCIPKEQLGLLAYADYTDPEHVHVLVPELPTDWKGKRIAASILMDKNNLRPHAAFLTAEKVADNELLSANGVLTYLGDKKMYMIGSEDKVSDPDAVVEPYLSLSTEDCIVEGEGLVSLAMRRTQASFYAYGTASVGIQSDVEDHLATVFGFTFPIDKTLVSAMADNIKEDLRVNPASPSTNAEMRHAMMYHLGADKGAAAYAVYSATGKLTSIPAAMQSMLLFDQVRWQYSPAVGLYYDGKVNLLAVDDKPLGVELRLKAQISKRGNAQQMTLYVEAAKDHWYYFKYDLSSSELTIYSSVGTWVDQVKAIPLEQRKLEKEGLATFRYFIGNNSGEVPSWLSWFSKTIYNDNGD